MDVINETQPAVISVRDQEDEYKKDTTDDILEFDYSSCSNEVLSNLNKLRKNKQFCDVVIQVSSKVDVHEVHCHRAVVASVSPYLFDVFNQRVKSNTVDRSLTDHCVLSGEYDIDVFESLIDFAYTSKLEIPRAKMKAMYLTAAKLKINPVSRYCGDFIVKNLTAENCLGIRAIFDEHSQTYRDLINQVDLFIRQNIAEVLNSPEISSIDKIQVELIQNSSEEITCTNERHLFMMILDYLKTRVDSTDIESLTEKIHMLYLNRDHTLHDCVDIEAGDVRDSEMVQEYKKLTKRLHHSNGTSTKHKLRKQLSSNVPTKPKQFLYTMSESSSSSEDEDCDREYRIIATVVNGHNSKTSLAIVNKSIAVLSAVQKVDTHESSTEQSPTSPNGHHSPVLQHLSTLQAMSNPRCCMGVAELNGSLFVCGGYDRGECLKSVEILHLAENRWSKLPDMSRSRSRTNVANLNDTIYAVGGSDGTKDLTHCEVYDPQRERWKSLAPLPTPREHAGVCAFQGKIYVIGGWNGQCGMTRVDVYDPTTNSWSLAAPLVVGRSQAGVVVLNGYIYAVGGCEAWTCTAKVERYCPENNEWTLVAPLQQPRRGCGVATLRGRIYAIGGHDSSQSLCSVEVYDPTTNSWSTGPSLTSCRANIGAAVVQGRVFVVGGFNGKNFLNTIECLDCEGDEDEWTAFVDKNKWPCSRESSSGISGC